MKTAFCIAWCFLFQVFALHAQSDYAPLECQGTIPKEFISSSTSKYRASVKNASRQTQKQQEAKARSRFALESNFNLDNLLRSGRVLFNDEVSNYLADVTHLLLDVQPLSRKQDIRIYALRSSAVNAFATERGEIFVTLGLIAQLENEAQLAYIIAHELAHVEKKHVINFYLEAEKLERSKGRSVLGRATTDENMLRMATYSKEHEHEADRLGLERILASPYRAATLPVVFDVLRYSYLPFDDLSFDRAWLQSEHYRLPDALWLEAVKPIEGEANEEDDSRSSHPGLQSRRQAMLHTLANHAHAPEKTDYAVSAQRFQRVRTLARYELPMLYLHTDQHADAIYTAGLLLQEQPDNLALKKCIAKALYLHAKLRNSKNYEYKGNYQEVEGQSQQLHYLLEKIPDVEATVLAWHFVWSLHRAYPADTEITTLANDLFFEFAREHNSFAELRNDLPLALADIAPADTAQYAPEGRSKYDRIREQKTSADAHADYWRYAFSGQLNDEAFVKYRESAEKRRDQWKENERYANSEKGKKEFRRNRKQGLSLGISKVVVINPFYLKLDERKGEAVQYIDTEKGREHLHSLIKSVSTVSGLKTTLLDVHDLKENQIETFNDIRYLNEWFSEQARHFDLSLTPGNEQERIDAIAEKYGTDYFLWTGIISLREKHTAADLAYLPLSLLLFPPAAPLAIHNLVKPKHEMLLFSILYDVRTGRRQIVKFDTFNQRDSDAIVKAHLYDAFTQIGTKARQ